MVNRVGISFALVLSRDYLFLPCFAPKPARLPTTTHLRRARAKSLILVYLGGGLSHHASFDPKPEATDDVRSKYGPIDTVVPGLRVSDKLPLMAKVMNKIAL